MINLISALVVSAHLLGRRDARRDRLAQTLTEGQRTDLLVTATCVVVLGVALTTWELLRG
jgi:hypothetical protein